MIVGKIVKTPFGVGRICFSNETDIIVTVEPLAWQMTRGQVPRFYLNKQDIMEVTFDKVIKGQRCLVNEQWMGGAVDWANVKIRKMTHEGRPVVSADLEFDDGRKSFGVPLNWIECDRLLNLKYMLGSLWNPAAITREGLIIAFDRLMSVPSHANVWKQLSNSSLWTAARAYQLNICRFLREDMDADVNRGNSVTKFTFNFHIPIFPPLLNGISGRTDTLRQHVLP